MTKFTVVLAVAFVVGSFAMTSCSSKENKMDEPVVSGAESTAAPVAAVDSANLGSASSGQGR